MALLSLEKSILSTLVYYDVLDRPLTGWEVFKYLIKGKSNIKEIKLNNVLEALENNQELALENYLKATDNKQIRVGKFKKFKPKFCSNSECKAEMTLHLSDGYLICTECGFCEEVILDSDKPNYKEPVPDATAYSYKRINHFNELTSWSNVNIPILAC